LVEFENLPIAILRFIAGLPVGAGNATGETGGAATVIDAGCGWTVAQLDASVAVSNAAIIARDFKQNPL